MTKKIKKVKVNTPKGVRTLLFRPIDSIPVETLICDSECSYGKICNKIPDPRDPYNPDSTFTDFCGDLSVESQKEGEIKETFYDLVPYEGTIEENLSDVYESSDVIKEIIKKDPLIKLSELINNLCSGWCDNYNKDYTNCTYKNKSCILRSLFKNKAKDNDTEK